MYTLYVIHIALIHEENNGRFPFSHEGCVVRGVRLYNYCKQKPYVTCRSGACDGGGR